MQHMVQDVLQRKKQKEKKTKKNPPTKPLTKHFFAILNTFKTAMGEEAGHL